MNSLSVINIIQIFFPALIGLGFVLFPVEDKSIRKLNLYIYCFIYFLLSAFSMITLSIGKSDLSLSFNMGGDVLFAPQRDIVKFILFSPLGYFIQIKQLEKMKDFLMNIFFQGIFFTLFNVSMYVGGSFSTYCVLELLVFSAIIISMINNCTWIKNNIILQGLGTALILISLIMVSALMRIFEPSGQIEVLKAMLGVIDLKLVLSFMLLLGILLKSTMIEYDEQGTESKKQIDIYRSVIKLYLPIRFLLESNTFQVMDSNIIRWIVIILCLVNCLRVTGKTVDLGILRLAELFSGLMILGFAILGSAGLYILIKYSFYLILLLTFYIDIERSERNSLFGLVLLMLSAAAITCIFYLYPGYYIGLNKDLPFSIITMIILYLMIKYIWRSIIASLKKTDLTIYNFDSCLVRNIIAIVVILILTEVDIKYFVEGSSWHSW